MKELITKFKSLDLRKVTEKEILSLIMQIGNTPVMLSELHEGKYIYRARPNKFEHEDFLKISDFSFRPQEFNNTYQRASTPNKTMFYGTLVPDDKDGELIDDERIIGAFEVVRFLRNPLIRFGEKVISYGIWRVNSTISTYAVLNSNIESIRVNWLKKIAKDYFDNLENYPEHKENSTILQNYLSKEFSKSVPERQNYQYKKSGIYTVRTTELGVDGILYPSVKVQGTGLNIALTPESVDTKMTLISVVKCKIYKKCDKVIFNNLKIGEINQNSGLINWKDLPVGEYRRDEKQIRKELSKIPCKPKLKRRLKKKYNEQILMRKRTRKILRRK